LGNYHAIALMTLSMATFAIGDALVKLSTNSLSPAQVILFMSIPATLAFAALARRADQPLWSPLFRHPAVLARTVIEALTAICMVSALSMAPLAFVISVTQAVPLLVTIGAALVLGERVGPRRWFAVIAGLCGVLLMLRPGAEGITLGAVLAVLTAIGLASRDIATRLVPPEVGTMQMATWGMGGLIPAGLILFPLTTPHGPMDAGPMITVLLAALATMVGYYAITAAMRIGEVSVVTPFRYSRLVFSLLIAVIFLNERPDALTLIGAAIVIGSGLFVLWRERVLARAAKPG